MFMLGVWEWRWRRGKERGRESEGSRHACKRYFQAGLTWWYAVCLLRKRRGREGGRSSTLHDRSHAYLLARLNLESKSSQDGKGGDGRGGEGRRGE